MANYVVIGGGIAATQAAQVIRSLADDDPITLVAEEERPFYTRPLLADFVAGRIPETRLWRSFEAEAEAKDISLLTGRKAVGIDREARLLRLSDGQTVPYDRLLVATGVKPTLPAIPGADLDGVTTFFSYADALKLGKWAQSAHTAVVVGRGLQGVELTRALRLRGLQVTMIVPDESPWFPALFEIKGELMEQALVEHGVNVVPLDSPVELIERAGHVNAVRTRQGRELKGEIVGFALDQRPTVDFLVGTGVSLAEGIVVDAHLKSTDDRIYAAGDVAQIEQDGKRRPIGYGWLRALAQGEVAARNMCGQSVTVAIGDESEAHTLYGMGLLARWS